MQYLCIAGLFNAVPLLLISSPICSVAIHSVPNNAIANRSVSMPLPSKHCSAFPLRFISVLSVPFPCVAPPCDSIAGRCETPPFLCLSSLFIAAHFRCYALLSAANPLLVLASLSNSTALHLLAYPLLVLASPSQAIASRSFSPLVHAIPLPFDVTPCHSAAKQCPAFAFLSYSMQSHTFAILSASKHCSSDHLHCVWKQCHSVA